LFGLGGNSGTKQKMQQRGLDFFTSWGVFRKIGLGLLGMGFVLMVILGDIPVGLAALATLIMVSKLWKAYDDMKNPTLGGLTPETESYKLSQLVTVIKRGPNNRGTWDLVKPVVSLGMGAPEDEPGPRIVRSDPDGARPHATPGTRALPGHVQPDDRGERPAVRQAARMLRAACSDPSTRPARHAAGTGRERLHGLPGRATP